jgi:hypothetical protein
MTWISVADRLPEPDSGEVLVWLTGGRCAFDEWHMHREDPTGMSTMHLMDMGYMWRDYDFEEITHWMPLPPPPAMAPTGEQYHMTGDEQAALKRALFKSAKVVDTIPQRAPTGEKPPTGKEKEQS